MHRHDDTEYVYRTGEADNATELNSIEQEGRHWMAIRTRMAKVF
jgi:hypothetical protein